MLGRVDQWHVYLADTGNIWLGAQLHYIFRGGEWFCRARNQ